MLQCWLRLCSVVNAYLIQQWNNTQQAQSHNTVVFCIIIKQVSLWMCLGDMSEKKAPTNWPTMAESPWIQVSLGNVTLFNSMLSGNRGVLCSFYSYGVFSPGNIFIFGDVVLIANLCLKCPIDSVIFPPQFFQPRLLILAPLVQYYVVCVNSWHCTSSASLILAWIFSDPSFFL